MDFLQKPSAWFSNFYLRVQSKNCGKNSFFVLFSEFFRIMSENNSDFWPKNFKNLSKLHSTCPEEEFVAFLSFETFRIFCRNIWHGSQYSIYVSRVKIAEKTVFFCIFPEFFRILSKIFSDFRPNNIKKISKLPTCPEEKFVTWNFFLKFWIVLDFLQKPSAWFSNFYLRVQSKNCEKNSFFVLFSEFFRIMSENNSDFWPKTSRICQNYLLRVQRKNLWLFFKFWNVSDFLQKHLAWFAIFYLRVQSKNCGKNSFFLYFSRIFSNFEQNFFRLSAKQHQKDFKTTYVSRGKVCDLKFFSKVLNRFGFSAETFGMVLKLLSTCPE